MRISANYPAFSRINGGFGQQEQDLAQITMLDTIECLTLPEELILMLLNEQNGYFYQVPGWDLNCAFVGAVLAELSLLSRIDTDLELLHLLDKTETDNPILDPILKQIADEPKKRNPQYWVERFTMQAESIIDLTLDHLVAINILQYQDGEFWTLNPSSRYTKNLNKDPIDGTASQFIKTRIREAVFTDTIPDPRDIIIISLMNTCDVFRLIYELDKGVEDRIDAICKMDLIGQSIARAVKHNIATPMLRRSSLNKKIPTVALRDLLGNKSMRKGNVPSFFAELAKQYGPVFQIRLPFGKPMIFLAGPKTNFWVHRRGRKYLRARDYFAGFEKIYGACGVLPSLDGPDHFRLRRAISPAYSRARLEDQMPQLIDYARQYMSGWKVGEHYSAKSFCRYMINAQISPLSIGVDTQDIIDDLIVFKERALNTYVVRALPRFMLHTPGIRRRAKAVDTLIKRIQSISTPAQRAGCPRNLADDWLSLHASDPALVPESNLRFALSATLVASVYLGDSFNFALYSMASQPGLYERIRAEADSLFDNGDPDGKDFTPDAIDVTRRFLMECLRMYPIVPMSLRDVMNSCVVEGYELPVGARLYIAQTATHYMEDIFPDPHKFDIDRHLSDRKDNRNSSYAPYGLGTHTCLGSRWLELQLAVNVLLIAHHFTLKVYPENYELRFNPLPSLKPTSNLNYLVSEKRREFGLKYAEPDRTYTD
ncbi:MAG: cytochrome P450 [Gammaproteobacteria bacterium]|nr:cytochrome P450 [Gammaproteobacteria bacterium]